MEVEEFKKKVKAHFNNAVRAVAERDDLDFYAIVQTRREDDDGHIIVNLFPSPMKEFYIEIISVEEHGDEWIVTTPQQRWAWRKIEEPDLKNYRAAMKTAGVNVG